EGAASPDGRLKGCYIHGLFGSDAFRSAFLENLGGGSSVSDYAGDVSHTLDALAQHLARHLDIEALLSHAAEV
ncbi:MAG: cobyric acid synthase CobQ, partial [Pseudomonadota bacterium]